MQRYKILLLLMILSYSVSAQDLSNPDNYNLDVDIRLDLLFGECPMFLQAGNSSLDGQFLNDTGTCILNFFNPAIPSPFIIIEPLTGDNLQNKIDFIGGELTITSILTAPLRVVNMMVYTIIEMMVSILNFMIAFIGRFFFTYMFYVSLGFNTLLGAIDQNRKLSDLDKMYTTVFMIAVATIYTLAGGWAWI